MSRSLRIGVVIGGQLVEERVFARGPITFGQSLRCDLSVPLELAPREHVLFDKSFLLQPLPGASIKRVGTRGRIALGEVTLLFQEVETVIAPKPRLPAALRQHHLDRRLAVIVGASLCVHIGIAAWAWTNDIEQSVFGERSIPTAFTQDTIDVTLPDYVDRVDPTSSQQTRPAVAPPVAPQHHIVQPVVSHPSDPQRLADEAGRMASILAGEDDNARGVGGMNHRQPGADLAHQLDDARNRTVTIGSTGHTSRADDRAALGTGGAMTLDDPSMQHAPEVRHETEQFHGRFQVVPLPGSDPGVTLTAQMVLDRIQAAYVPGLTRCYRLGQNEDATLQGKISIEFTVDERGKVIDPSAQGLTTKVDGCVANLMAGWRFSIPKDKSGAPTEATFKLALILKGS